VLAGEPGVTLNMSAGELLAEPIPVAAVIAAALDRPDTNLSAHFRVHEAFRRSGLSQQLIDSLAHKNPLTRAAAARLCGALRLTESVPWVGDLVEDPNPMVREVAVRALGQLGGRRAVELLMAAEDRIPLYRLAIALSQAASDVDIESLMRQPKHEKAALVTVLACGLRRDVLRVPPLLGIAHDRRWPRQVRIASCKSLAMIGDPSALDGLSHLADGDPDPRVKQAADRARRRLRRAAIGAKR
jgi:HEAT repeat protein